MIILIVIAGNAIIVGAGFFILSRWYRALERALEEHRNG